MLKETLTPQDITAVAVQLRQYMEQHGLSQQTVARSISCSSATISQFLNHQYPGDCKDLAMRVRSWMEEDLQRRRAPKFEGFVMTDVARRIFMALKIASKTNSIAIIHGPAGLGKTFTLQAYLVREPNAVYVRVRVGSQAARGFLALLCDAIRVKNFGRTDQIFERIQEKLSSTGRMILIDEAHRLKFCALEAIRDIHDLTGCPIALIGTDQVVKTIDGNLNDRNGWITDQFNSRNCTREDLMAAIRSGGSDGRKLLYSQKEICDIFDAKRVRLVPEAARWLAKIASTPGEGGLRRVNWVMTMCELAFPSERITLAYAREAYAKITSKAFLPADLMRDEPEESEPPAVATG